MKADVFDIKNQKIGEADLPERIFAVKWNPDLVNQALTAQLANSRVAIAHAKGRGEVRGGGKKPWKQKGTGRARHGSIRSPLWKGGGATFGPSKERVFSKKINKKMKRLAIFNVLAQKAREKELKIIDSFKIEANKTKDWNKILKNMVDLRSKNLLVVANANKKVHGLTSNIKNIRSISPFSLNVYDLLSNKNVFMEKEAVAEMENHFKG